MPRAPKLASFPAIRGALKFYQVASIITGVGLLLLVAEMILKYTPIHLELFLGGSGGFLWFATVIAGVDCEWYSLFFPGSACEMVSTGDGISSNSSTAKPMASAVSIVRGDVLAITRSNGPSASPTRRAARTPSGERCEPRPRLSPFFVNECRRSSTVRMNLV